MFDRSDNIPPSPYRRLDGIDDIDEETLDPTEEINLATLDLFEDRKLAVSLPVNAALAYEVFCDIEQVPRWVSIINSVQVLDVTPRGRVSRAAFIAGLDRASVGYTLEYEYRNAERVVSWWTPDQPMMRVGGRAQFSPLGDRACMMNYELYLDVPEGALPQFANPYFDGHAPSAVLADFRDYLGRISSRLQ